MGQHNEAPLVYPYTDNSNYQKYGFLDVDNGLIFSSYFIKAKDEIWRSFIVSNLRQIGDAYWLAMNLDNTLVRNRTRKLSTFLRHMWVQEDTNVVHIMLSAVNLLNDSYNESDLIGKIINDILPNAGYKKHHIDSKYIWKFKLRNVFDIGINKLFVMKYISNRFDKDATWKEIKKYCYLKDGKWRCKNNIMKQQVNETISSYLKNGGIVVETNVDLEFSTFIPLSKSATKEGTLEIDSYLAKSDDGKKYRIQGVASDTSEDTDEERITENFISAMKKQVIGLPLKVGSHFGQDLDSTVGVITGKGGTSDKLYIEGELQPPEDNINTKKIMDKMKIGIKYGFSIFGKVTRLYREVDKKTGKEMIHLDDGVLSHILITDQPANKNTFAQGIFKSLDMQKIRGVKRDVSVDGGNDYKHNSNLSKSEPAIDELGELPVQAYPIEYSTGTVEKEFPHHYIQNGQLYLHKGMLLKSYLKAKKDAANNFVIQHLLNHIHVVGLTKTISDLENIKTGIDDIQEVQGKLSELSVVLKGLADSVTAVKKLHNTKEEKMKIVAPVISDVAQKISAIMERVYGEETNG